MPERRRRALAVLCLLAACAGQRPAPPDAAARVGDEIIPYAEFEAYVASRVGLDGASSSLVLSGLLDQYLDEVLLRLLALEEGRIAPDAPGWEAVDALLAGRPPQAVSEQEIAAYYDANPDAFARPERVLLHQILAEDRDTAERIAELMAGGEDFAEVGSRFRDAVSATRGELGREDLPAAFVDSIFDLEPGEVSEVIATDYGFHVFQVVDWLPAERSSLAEARPRIVDLLSRQGRRRALEELVAEARGRYNVEVFARNLPFNYEGQYESSKS